MAKQSVVQTNFLSGVLDPRAAARVDTDAYSNGMRVGENVTVLQLGGVRRRPGLKIVTQLPNILNRLTSSASVTAPEGGTAANINDDDPDTVCTTTNNISTGNPYVVAHYDLGVATSIAAVDIVEAKLTAGTSAEFAVQYSTDNVSWSTLDSVIPLIDTTERSYRRGSHITEVTARYVRFARVGATNLTTAKVTLGGMAVWTEDSTLSAVRLIPFEVNTSTRYLLALTDRSMVVFQSGNIIAVLPSPYTSAQLADVDAAQSQDSLVLVHEDHQPRFVYPELSTVYYDRIPFSYIPQVDFNDVNSPTAVSDVQVITFASGWKQGETFQMELEGAKTAAIVYAGDIATTAANIEREVQKLYTVRGFSGVSCARTGTREFTVTFANDSANAYDVMSGIPLSASADITVTQTTPGTARAEDAWSTLRGWPRTVTFFEGRLYFGGAKSLPQTVFGSKVGEILDFEVGEARDDDGIQTTLANQQLNAVQGILAGRALQFFTTGGEFRYLKPSGQPITPADAPANQTQYGSAKIRPVAIDGATLYVQRTRKVLRDFRFDYEEDAYNSASVSSLAPHLINDIVDLAAWNGSATDEISLVFVVNGDGTMAVLNSKRDSNVQAWTKWTTAGEFKAATAVLEDLYFAVARDINGTDKLLLEQADDDYYLDSATQTAHSPASNTGEDLGHLDGALCRVRADGAVLTDATPSGGTVTVEGSYSLIEVGLGFTPKCTPNPIVAASPTGTNFIRKRRIVKVRVKVYETAGLLMNGRVMPDRSFDVDSYDAAPTPYTGSLTIEETTNWDESEEKLVEFTQVDPLPMTILGVDTHIEWNE